MYNFSNADPFGKGAMHLAIRLADRCISSYVQVKGWRSRSDIVIDVQDIYDNVIYPEYEISLITNQDLGYNKENEKILGVTDITKDIIYIDPSIAPPNRDPRYVVTLAHEMGHALLHNTIDQDLRYTPDALAMFDMREFNELQADIFAEYLATPYNFLSDKFNQHYGIDKLFIYKGPGLYIVNLKEEHIQSVDHFYQILAQPLLQYFVGIPMDTLVRTMKKMQFIEDITPRDPLFSGAPRIENVIKKIHKQAIESMFF